MGAMVELNNIHKSLGGKAVLNGVSLEVNKGEVVVILGPSGGGKTTLLRTINFLNPADSGTVTIDGLSVDSSRKQKSKVLELRRRTAMVFQNYCLFKNKTVLDNITEGPVTVQKKSRKEAEAKAAELLDRVHLTDKKDSYPSELSGGQQQRVGICRALALEPRVILFDEPTSALDPELVGGVLATIKDVAATGITMIIVTHEIKFAREVADKVVFMEGGKIVEEGPPEQVIDQPQDQRTRKFLCSLLGEDYGTDYYI